MYIRLLVGTYLQCNLATYIAVRKTRMHKKYFFLSGTVGTIRKYGCTIKRPFSTNCRDRRSHTQRRFVNESARIQCMHKEELHTRTITEEYEIKKNGTSVRNFKNPQEGLTILQRTESIDQCEVSVLLRLV